MVRKFLSVSAKMDGPVLTVCQKHAMVVLTVYALLCLKRTALMGCKKCEVNAYATKVS